MSKKTPDTQPNFIATLRAQEIVTSQDLATLKSAVKNALNLLYEKDLYLLENAVHERTIVAHFATHLKSLAGNLFTNYNLDLEYNRNGDDVKEIEKYPHGIIPDLLIHKRGKGMRFSKEHTNILAIEFKTYWNNDEKSYEEAEYKISSLLKEYNYKLGAVIVLEKTRDSARIDWKN